MVAWVVDIDLSPSMRHARRVIQLATNKTIDIDDSWNTNQMNV
ncbi:MAG: hypothetical protein AAF639_21130 [Chloroflexota bacterium]